MAPPSPHRNGGINRLLQGLNHGLNNLIRGGPRVEETASSEDEESPKVVTGVLEPVAVANIGGNQNHDTIALQPEREQYNDNSTQVNENVSPDLTMAKSGSRKEPGRPKKKNDKKKKGTTNDNNSNSNGTSADPPRMEVADPTGMDEAFDEGHDTDGWEGPPRGTNEKEIELAAEDPVEEEETVAEQQMEPLQQPEPEVIPAHIPIPDNALEQMTIAMLKHKLTIQKVSLKSLKNKAQCQNKLREALAHKLPAFSVVALEAEKEKNKNKKKPDDVSCFAIGAKWKQLTPDVDVPEPINEGFLFARAPTVPDADKEVPPKPKQSFTARFDRPMFTGRTAKRETHAKADGTTGFKTTTSIRTKGRAAPKFLHKHGLNSTSLPVEFTDAFFPMHENKYTDKNGDPHMSMESLTRNANLRANLLFAGEATCDDWSGPFTIKEVRQHLGLHMLNGLSPSPGLDRKFDTNDVAAHNAFVSNNFGKQPIRRLKQFRTFFTCQDPLKPTPTRADSPLFKVLSVIKWVRRVGPMSWECGIHLGLDEMTIGFQGHHVDKQRTTHKKEGDGFQCDALCESGFTCSVFFRNENPPPQHERLGFSPLHARSLWLFDQLKDDCHRVWVDNLYMSAKFAKGAYNLERKVLLAGVTRTKDRGLPNSVIQEPVKEKDIPTTRGTVQASVLHGDAKCPHLVALSIYDSKPVHFLSMIAESVEWKEMQRDVWNKTTRRMQPINFLRINANDDYNHKMNSVDVADQLRNQCRMDHWLRNRKWWWSIFMWGMGVLLTNSYVLCRQVQEEQGVPAKDRLTHCDFLLSVARAWIDQNETDIRTIRRVKEKKRKERENHQHQTAPEGTTTPSPPKRSRHSNHSTDPSTALVSPPKSASKAPRANDKTLDPKKGLLRFRLNHFANFHCPEKSACKVPSCALHRWLLGRDNESHGQTRNKIVACSVCQVNLCIPCFRTFHAVDDLLSKKDELRSKLEQTAPLWVVISRCLLLSFEFFFVPAALVP